MKKANGFLIGTASFLAGVVLGFLISPAKNGFGNNSGNQTHYHYGEKHYTPKDKECSSATCPNTVADATIGVTSGEAELSV